jgi:hypothetical protein
MVGEPRDRTAFSIAIAGLGFVLVLLLAGICWIATQNSDPSATDAFTHGCAFQPPVHCRPAFDVDNATLDTSVLDGLWVAFATLAGVFVGTLIPFSLPTLQPDSRYPDIWRWKWDLPSIAAITITVISPVAILLWSNSLLLFATAGLLLGLLIPSPARRD